MDYLHQNADYIFVCIGTNKLIADSFGPRVGDILKVYFKNFKQIQVFGTMKCPIHLQNAPIFLDYLQQNINNIILIDSALGDSKKIGNTYLCSGGLEIGKAFERTLYFPARLSFKTIVGSKRENKFYEVKSINNMAQNLAGKIVDCVNKI